jgi:hypothetical protein
MTTRESDSDMSIGLDARARRMGPVPADVRVGACLASRLG